MALLQISEPGLFGEPHKHNVAIGIDLGTTNSLVATVKSGDAVVLCDTDGNELIPSVVYYSENNPPLVGQKALQYRITDPADTITSVKRFMGRNFAEIDVNIASAYKFATKDNTIEIITAQGKKHPVQISADILRHLKDLATQSLGEEPIGAVITVPAYFDDAQRQATKQAGELAGLNVLRLLNEPTAAAIAYGLDAENAGTFIVFDLGGGTLDVSALRLNNGVFEVLAVSGDTRLGGDDFDHRLYCHILDKSQLSQLNDSDVALLLNKSRAIKEQLTTQEQVSFMCVLSNKRVVNMIITRNEFDALTKPLVEKALLPLRRVLRDTGLAINEIKQIIMVGGSTRMPNIRSAVANFFGREPLTNIDPDKVVALGAAIQANVLAGNKKDDDWLLLDVTPLSLGIETMGEIVEKIIPRNSTIPIARAQEFTTYKDGQTAMIIHVLQGERELVKDCRSLATFTLRGIPPMVAGAARIRITFRIDADGLLSVSAQEQISGVASSIEVKPSFGLMDEQISNMLKESITHAVDDIQARQFNEVKVEVMASLDAVAAALNSDNALLSEVELANIQVAWNKLQACYLEQGIDLAQHTKQLKQLIDELNLASDEFAAKRMNNAVASALSGKNIDNLNM